MKHEQISLMGVPFTTLKESEVIALVLKKMVADEKRFFIATPNPEMLLEAKKNEPFKKILNTTDLNIPDGFGIILASWMIKKPLHGRITGTDLMQTICRFAPEKTKIFLLGAEPGIAKKTAEILEKEHSHLKVSGTYSGSPAPHEEHHIRDLINNSEAQILFVAFGAPKQEMWISRNLPHLKNIKIAMGVGGAFDFISGNVKRAPRWMRKLGLEWLFRLIKQPTRIKRIYNATIKFPVVFIASLFKKN